MTCAKQKHIYMHILVHMILNSDQILEIRFEVRK